MKFVWEKMWPELRVYKWRLLGVLAIGAVTSAMKAVTPEITRRLQMAWESGDRTQTLWLPVALAGLWTLANVGRFFHITYMKFTSDMIAISLRRQLMNKYLSLNLGFYQSFVRGSGGLISRMINDINIIMGGTHKIADVVREPFMVVFAFAYLIHLDWTLTLFVMAAAPITIGILRSLARSLRKYSRTNQETAEDLTSTLKESLDGSRIVQSFTLEDEMRRRFDEQTRHFLATQRRIAVREELAGPVSETIAAFTLSTVLVYIGTQIINKQLTMGDFLGFSFAIGLLQDSIKKIQDSYVRIQQSAVALERLHTILDSDQTVPVIQNPKSFPKNWHEIEFRNVSFRYADEPILRQVNLKVRSGETVAIVGSSGGGKSTLVNLLPRFFDPTDGEILIGGVPIQDMDLKQLRNNIALVSQDVFLFADTIERNIWSGDFKKNPKGVQAAAKSANADSFISRMPQGYQSRVGERGSTLSGGEKQRISIARAIFKDAPILVLDEATSALDSESEQEVQKGLEKLMEGRTVFVIAHRLSTIAKADRILVMQKGQIVEQGSHSDLLRQNGEYARYLNLQQAPSLVL